MKIDKESPVSLILMSITLGMLVANMIFNFTR
jgi:hypothetical protein